MVKTVVGLLWLLALGMAQTERWVFSHQEPTPRNDAYAFLVCVGQDHNVYAAGSEFGTHLEDFLVVSLSPDSGRQRWHYVYDPLGNADVADAGMIYAPDGNLYVAGVHSIHTVCNLAVVSLDSRGAERWTYEYCGQGGGQDWANSAPVWSGDGKLYVCGEACDTGRSNGGAIVVGLTSQGEELWVTSAYDLPNTEDCLNDLALDADGKLYGCGLAGVRSGLGSGFLVVSLEPDSGRLRWVRVYDGVGDGYDQANSLVCGPDGNVYVCGYENGSVIGGNRDLVVLCLTPQDSLLWSYRYAGPAGGKDSGLRIRIGHDGNLYVVGYSSNGTDLDGLLLSLTPQGQERWAYRYDSGPGDDDFTSLAFDSSGSVIACGVMGDAGSGTGWLSAVCFSSDGQRLWDYAYRQALGAAYDVACDQNKVYLAGPTLASNGWVAFTVISLEATTGTQERVFTGVRHNSLPATVVRGILKESQEGETKSRAELCDVSGRKALPLRQRDNDLSRLVPGVYFVRRLATVKKVVVVP